MSHSLHVEMSLSLHGHAIECCKPRNGMPNLAIYAHRAKYVKLA